MNQAQTQNMTALFMAFFIIVLGVLFSAFLIIKELKVEGTVFAGATIVAAAAMFLKHGKKDEEKPKKK